MTLKPEFFRYLDHFGHTVTMRQLHEQHSAADAIGLRHDIDHSLDLALEVAHHEHARGIRATYFLLHTHPYWRDEQLLLKCRQLVAYGHEVGLHINLLTQWFTREIDDPALVLRSILQQLRSAGIDVVGMSAHGDKICYQHQYINYWLFRELRGENPQETELGRSPEGVIVDDPQRQVRYPQDHQLRRDDGALLPLWSISSRELGLHYDAAHVPVDRYWTDTGGSWTRSPDPMNADLSKGRHQVLMHPFWWRGPSKYIFVLSTARAGSSWLANFVDRATNARGLHEWTFNHRRDGREFFPDKRTNDDYLGLIENEKLSEKLIDSTHAYFRIQKRDMLEANVYLEPFIEQITRVMPEAVLVHLHRNGRDVVRSILNRRWYDTPLDRKHRAVPLAQWHNLNQFQRACWYYRFTNERLAHFTNHRLSFERMVSDRAYLTEQLAALGLIVHPLLADNEFGKRINAAASNAVPVFEEWPAALQAEFASICGGTQELLGYETAKAPPLGDLRPLHHVGAARTLCRWHFNLADTRKFTPHELELLQERQGLLLTRSRTADSAAYLLLARGAWKNMPAGSGLPCRPSALWRARLRAQVPAGPLVRLFVIYYDDAGDIIDKQQLASLRSDQECCELAFTRAEPAARMAIAVHMLNAEPGTQILLKSFALIEHQFDDRYRFSVPTKSLPLQSRDSVAST
jgi:hypothetical protein